MFPIIGYPWSFFSFFLTIYFHFCQSYSVLSFNGNVSIHNRTIYLCLFALKATSQISLSITILSILGNCIILLLLDFHFHFCASNFSHFSQNGAISGLMPIHYYTAALIVLVQESLDSVVSKNRIYSLFAEEESEEPEEVKQAWDELHLIQREQQRYSDIKYDLEQDLERCKKKQAKLEDVSS